MLALAGNPQAGLGGALIAGTNGKGSSAAMLASILGAGGRRVGTMPSPHLSSYTERVQVNGTPISEGDFAAAVDELAGRLEHLPAELGPPTEFEILTVVALSHLARHCDLLVIEVGMGGRLDSTNVLDLGIAVITNVTIDHAQYLGDTVEKIAAEKAGIIKPGNRVLTAAEGGALQVLEERAAAAQAQLWRLGHELSLRTRSLGWRGSDISVSGPGFSYEDIHVPLVGEHQAANAALAVAAGHLLGQAPAGIGATSWPGRLELVGRSPLVVLDGGHNPDALRRVGREIRQLEAGRRLIVVFGLMADKDVEACLAGLRAMDPAEVVFTAAGGSRPARPELLAAAWGGGEVSHSPEEAASRAIELAGPQGLVVVCGSLYLVGELRPILLDRPR